jgi:hypothetical protein
MTENFNILVHKLKLFRRKYYFYKMVKGVLLTLLISILLYTILSVVEYFAYLPSLARTFIFYAGIVFLFGMVLQFVLIPFFQLIRVFRQLNDENLNQIIVRHFPEIKDKLLNILELSRLHDRNYSPEIVLASIDQKINQIKIFNFQSAIRFRQLRFVLIYLLVSILIVGGIVVFDKPVIAESNYRIINYGTRFSKPAPYEFVLQNNDLVVNKGDEYTFLVKCQGEKLPQVVFLNIEGSEYLMKKKEANQFEYKIESVLHPLNFFFTDKEYRSPMYSLQILPKPGISDFTVQITPPEYTRMKKEKNKNVGDLTVVEGTQVQWNFTCIDTDSLYIRFSDEERMTAAAEGKVFTVDNDIYRNTEYRIYIKNSYTDYQEVLSYNVNVIPDLYPEIRVVQTRDSSHYSRFYFMGEVLDDYGFSALNFHLNGEGMDTVFPLQITKNIQNQEFYYTTDFQLFDFASEEITYYFSVSDNDAVNGPKTTTSESYVFLKPSDREIRDFDREQFAEIENKINESQILADEIRKDLKELQYKNLDANVTEWEKSQLVNEIIHKKNQLEKILDQVKVQNDALNNFIQSFASQEQEILEKQNMIEELMEEIFSDELKELMEEFQKLAEEFNENRLNNLSEKLDMSMDDLSKQLDRNLEMLRRMKVEQKIQTIIDEMYKVAEMEQNLAEEISEERNFEETAEKDNKNKEEVNRLEEELKETLKMNKQLKDPLIYDDFAMEFTDIKESFEINKENLEKKRKNKASQSIQNTAGKLQNLAFSMDQLLQSNRMNQHMENIEDIRQLLSNLIWFSFSQEELMMQVAGMDVHDPVFQIVKRNQKSLRDQHTVIKDSLYALAERTPHISNLIGQELLNMDMNMKQTEEKLAEGAIPASRVNQQFVLTSANTLALFLYDALRSLEDQMANCSSGCQNCENPGQKPGGENMDMIRKSSEGMKEQLQKMIEEMKNGQSPKMSKMLGESMMQYEMMQRMLREIINNGSVGSDARETLKKVDQLLEQTRLELMNKSISQKTVNRQNQILTRLLEAEKAEIERDFDEKRESETADQEFYSNPVRYFEFNKQEKNRLENLEQNVFKLSNFYNKKYRKYIEMVKEQGGR